MLYAAVVGVLVGVLLTASAGEFLGLFADKPRGHRRRRGPPADHGLLLLDLAPDGRQHRRLRGLSRSVAPTIMVILGSCVFRVIWIYTIFAYFHTITSLYLLYMFSWILTGVAEYIYFRITYKRNAHCPRHMVTKRPCQRHGLFLLRRYCTAVNRAAMSAVTSSGEAAQRHAEGVIARLQAYQQLIRGDVAVHGGYGHGGNVLLTGKIHGGQLAVTSVKP